MKELLNTLDKNRESIDLAFSDMYETIKNIIIKEGGYINTANNDEENDNIYGAVIDFCGTSELVEVMVKALKVEDNTICCYVAPITLNKIIYDDDDYIKNDEDNWYALSPSDNMLYHYTLLNIADVFNFGEYLTSTEE